MRAPRHKMARIVSDCGNNHQVILYVLICCKYPFGYEGKAR